MPALKNYRNQLFCENESALEPKVMLAASVGPRSRNGAGIGNPGTLDDRRAKTQDYSDDRKTARRGRFELFDITRDGIADQGSRNSANGLTLANRVERRLPRLEHADGDRFRFEGRFRIDEADNVYFAQLHADDRSPDDPRRSVGRGVHWLLRADQNPDDPNKLDIYLEQATEKEGRRSNGGRRDILLRSINKGQQLNLKVTGGTDLSGENIFSVIEINGRREFAGRQRFTSDFQSVRYGAYGAPGGGNAEVLWQNVSYREL